METCALRLHPGQDLKLELEHWAAANQVEAACVLTCVGSLRETVVRFANQPAGTRLEGKFEIVSLTGVFSRHGGHYHIGLTDSQGHGWGGHLLEGCLIYTTAELVLGVLPKLSFRRTFDAETGYPELDIS